MISGRNLAVLTIVCSLLLVAVVACNGEKNAGTSTSLPAQEAAAANAEGDSAADLVSPEPSPVSAEIVPEVSEAVGAPASAPRRLVMPRAEPAPVLPTLRPTPDIPATVAAEVYIRQQVEEQVKVAVEAESTPVPGLSVQEGLVLELYLTPGPVIAGEDLEVEVRVTNQLSETIRDINLEFDVSWPSKLESLSSDLGECAESACHLPALDGNRSAAIQATLTTELSLQTEIKIDAVVSWHTGDSSQRKTFAHAITTVRQGEQPGSVLWSTPFYTNIGACDRPVSVDYEAVYASFGKEIYAVSRTSGKELWRHDGRAILDQPSQAGRSIYFKVTEHEGDRDYNNYLYSLDTLTGRVNWRSIVEKGTVWKPPLIYGDDVYLVVRGTFVNYVPKYGYLMSFEASTGELNWSYRVDDGAKTPPTVLDESIYFANERYIFSVDPESGELIRQYRADGRIFETPAISDGKAYIIRSSGSIYSTDLATGEIDWEHKPEGGRASGKPVVADGHVYFHVYDVKEEYRLSVLALDAVTGRLVWEYRPGGWVRRPSFANGSVYVASSDRLVSLDPRTGEANWSAYYPGICDAVVVADGIVYVRASDRGQKMLLAIREGEKTTPVATEERSGHLSVSLETPGDGKAVAGEELAVSFTVTNQSPEPVSGINLAFEVAEPGHLVEVGVSRGECAGLTCDIGSLDGLESITGHVALTLDLSFDTQARVDADVSWLRDNSRRRHSYAETTVELVDGGRPGDLVWLSYVNTQGMGCDDGIELDATSMYATFGKKLVAFPRSTGERLWAYEVEHDINEPVLAEGNIYFDSWSRDPAGKLYYHIYSVDAEQGELNWQHSAVGRINGRALVYDDSVFFAFNEVRMDGQEERGYLMAFDPESGVLNWRYRVDKWITKPLLEYKGNIVLYTAERSNPVRYLVDPRTGDLNRKEPITFIPYGTPLFSGRTTFFASGSNAMYSIDQPTGEVNWKYRVKGNAFMTPQLYEGNLYFFDYELITGYPFTMDVVEAETGSLKWSYRPGYELSWVVLDGGKAFVGTLGEWPLWTLQQAPETGRTTMTPAGPWWPPTVYCTEEAAMTTSPSHSPSGRNKDSKRGPVQLGPDKAKEG